MSGYQITPSCKGGFLIYKGQKVIGHEKTHGLAYQRVQKCVELNQPKEVGHECHENKH